MNISPSKPVIVALDFATEKQACQTMDLLDPALCRIKIGKELFTSTGPVIVRRAIDAGFDVFLDLKYHDIPNTVAGACSAAADLGCWMINLHASGGRAMMETASERLSHHRERPMTVAVTVLTSLDEAAINEVGYTETIAALVVRLAALSQDCGLDGVVCSTYEIESIRHRCGEQFVTVTPGVRPKNSGSDDQRRVATPAQALAAGADFLVIGRPITQAENCAAALQRIYSELPVSRSLT